jgi:hypothetical protein
VFDRGRSDDNLALCRSPVPGEGKGDSDPMVNDEQVSELFGPAGHRKDGPRGLERDGRSEVEVTAEVGGGGSSFFKDVQMSKLSARLFVFFSWAIILCPILLML